MDKPSKRSKLKELKSLVQKMDGNSYNPQAELLELLKSKCPEAFTEGKIDPKKLRQTLGEEVSEEGERYGLSWAGKSDCFRHIQEPTTATLKPIKKESIDFDKTENIFIEGDNLEVLKALQKSYYGSIKMIYIDPPYNTGNDSFIYPDRYKEEKEDYELRAGIKDAEGLLTKDGFWRKNSKDAGHFHSNWLSMMYPRLFLAKNLLREDGVIFVSIDDNEVQNLRMIMDELFCEENFIGIIAINSSPSAIDYGHLAKMHDYVVFYAKSLEETSTVQLEDENKEFKYSDEIGPFNLYPLYNGNVAFNPKTRPNLYYPFFLNPKKVINNEFYEIGIDKRDGWIEVYPVISRKDKIQRVWRWGKEKARSQLNKEIIGYKNEDGEFRIVQKTRLTGKVIRSLQIDKDISSRRGTGEVESIFGKKIFPFPKPIELVKRFISISTVDDDIILDFFAGSATTAHAVFDLNKQDRSDRKFILVQLPEPCEEESEAFKAGFKTIAEIGKERIRRAAKKIKEENKGKLDFDGKKLDLGFKVFKLSESNFKQWRENIKTGEELKEQMKMFVDNTKKESRPEDMLYEIILKNSRFDLNVKVSKKSFDGVDYYRLADGVEIVCLASKITKKFVDKVLSEKPEKFTCLDIAFKENDQLKTNTALQMESSKIEFKVI
jgi:adenine-specific DNA-methyltransferase